MKKELIFLAMGLMLLFGCTDVLSGNKATVGQTSGYDGFLYSSGSSSDSSSRTNTVPSYAPGAIDSQKESAIAPTVTDNSGQNNGQLLTKEGTITIEVKKGELDPKLAEAKAMLATENAKIVSISYNEYYGQRVYSIMFKITPAKFDSTLEKLKTLGDVTGENLNIEDVTKQHQDLELRLNNKYIELARLQTLYNKSEKIEDMLAIEREITRIEGEIDQITSDKEYLENKVAESTITLSISEPLPVSEQKEGEVEVKVKENSLETQLKQLKAIVGTDGEIISLNFAETSDYTKYYVVIRTAPANLDGMMESVKKLGEVKNVEKTTDESNRPKKSLLYITLQEDKPAVQTSFTVNWESIGMVFFATLSGAIYVVVGIIGLAIPLGILVFVAYKLYRAIKKPDVAKKK